MGRPKKEQEVEMVECRIIRMEESLREHKVGDIVKLGKSLFDTLESWGFVEDASEIVE